MNQNMNVERLLTTYMADETAGRVPDRLFDDIVSATGRARPDPRWLALLKEPPMRIQSRVAVGTPMRGLVLAAAAAGVLILALLAALVGASLLRQPQPVVVDDWPMFRGDPTHAGLAIHGPTGRPVINWRYRAQGAVTQNVSIVGDLVFVPTDFGFVDGVRLSDGVEQWSVKFIASPTSGVIVADGLVLVRDGSGVAYGLDPATGKDRWRSVGTAIGASNGTVGAGAWYVGSDDGDLVAFDTKTGAERWRVHLGGGAGVGNTAYSDGLVYVATAQAGFFALDARTGAIRWRVDVGDQTTGTPVVADGIAYVGAGSGATTGRLRAVDAKTGKLLWQIDEPVGSPSFENGVAYASAPELTFEVAFDPKTGSELWRHDFSGPGTTRAAVVAGGVVYVPQDGEHRIYALDAATGGELWNWDVGSGNQCCLAVTKGSIFVGTDDGIVFRIGGDGSVLTPASVPPPASSGRSPGTSP